MLRIFISLGSLRKMTVLWEVLKKEGGGESVLQSVGMPPGLSLKVWDTVWVG